MTPFAVTTTSRVPILDDPITETEILQAGKKLKEGRSTADARVTIIAGILFTFLSTPMNLILKCSFYPTQWRITIVLLSSRTKDVAFYRRFTDQYR